MLGKQGAAQEQLFYSFRLEDHTCLEDGSGSRRK